MKRMFLMVLVVMSVALADLQASDEGPAAARGVPRAVAPQGMGAVLDIGYCYDYLAPFGTWIQLGRHGYVWCPRHMGYRWRPYTHGHWIWSDFGWMWMSDYEWGWMPFHYGRWGWDDDCGWFWVPDVIWGPAWVTWRYSDLYFGWAPIPPGVAFRAGIDFDVLALGIPYNFWVFVSGPRFLDRDISRYCLPYERNTWIIGRTSARNRYDFRGGRLVNEGFDVETVRRVTRRTVTRHRLQDSDRPGEARISGEDVRIYRPSLREDSRARPKEFIGGDQARRELAPVKIYEPPRQAESRSPESAVRKRQSQEESLLKKSQSRDKEEIERRRKEESRKVGNPAEKAKVRQDYQARTAEQQKQHQAERQQLEERHRRDAEQVKKSAPPKRTPPPRKKK